MLENKVQAEIMLAIGALPGVRVFRNTVGEGWQGKMVENKGGFVVLKNARYVTFGLCPGSADLIGWRSIEVLPSHVGRRLALFLSPEVKTVTGPTRDLQTKFLAAVNAAGGLAGIVRSPENAVRLVSTRAE